MPNKFISNAQEFFEQTGKENLIFPISENNSLFGLQSVVSNKVVPNRIVYQAMEGCDGKLCGSPDDLTIRRYLRFAKSGAGIIWVEATAIVNEGRANPRQLYLTKENKESFKTLVERIKETAKNSTGIIPILILQLTHSGRYSKPNGLKEPLIAYNNPLFEESEKTTHERVVTDEYLDSLKEKFLEKSLLAMECGFDGVDIKSCHGYLLCELLSAYKREGKYGGSFLNRTRLLRESIKLVKSKVKNDFIVTTRLNAYDGFPFPYGFGVKENCGIEPDFSECTQLINLLREDGVDLVDITMGNPYVNPHVNRPFATGGYVPSESAIMGVFRMLEGILKIKKETKETKIICSGVSYLGAMLPKVCLGYLEKGIDFIGIGRMTLAYPEIALDLLKGDFKASKGCICCSKCSSIMRSGNTPGCVIRDSLYLDLYKKLISEGVIK